MGCSIVYLFLPKLILKSFSICKICNSKCTLLSSLLIVLFFLPLWKSIETPTANSDAYLCVTWISLCMRHDWVHGCITLIGQNSTKPNMLVGHCVFFRETWTCQMCKILLFQVGPTKKRTLIDVKCKLEQTKYNLITSIPSLSKLGAGSF